MRPAPAAPGDGARRAAGLRGPGSRSRREPGPARPARRPARPRASPKVSRKQGDQGNDHHGPGHQRSHPDRFAIEGDQRDLVQVSQDQAGALARFPGPAESRPPRNLWAETGEPADRPAPCIPPPPAPSPSSRPRPANRAPPARPRPFAATTAKAWETPPVARSGQRSSRAVTIRCGAP